GSDEADSRLCDRRRRAGPRRPLPRRDATWRAGGVNPPVCRCTGGLTPPARQERLMRLSIYTFVKNGLFQDYHVVDMLRHHLPLADEIIVNEGYSTDGTYEAISQIDPKIKIFRTRWGQAASTDWYLGFKNDARQRCTGDWCLLLDCDEFIPEWEFDRLREYIERTKDLMAPVRLLNFYGNCKVFHRHPEKVTWPARKM